MTGDLLACAMTRGIDVEVNVVGGLKAGWFILEVCPEGGLPARMLLVIVAVMLQELQTVRSSLDVMESL